MRVEIEKSRAVGRLSAPPSKSMAHRLLICAAMSEGKSTVRGISSCEDVLATLDCMTALGINYEINGDDVTVYGKHPSNFNPKSPLVCRESGSTLRFMLPIAMMSGRTAVFYGEKRLMARPMSVYEKICEEKGLSFIADGESIVVNGVLTGGEYSVVGNISSQFISGLLFALPSAKADSLIRIAPPIESRSYIELTLDALHSFGIEADWANEYTISVKGNQAFRPTDITVEGDFSGAAFPDALNIFGGEVELCGLKEDSLQGDRVYKKH